MVGFPADGASPVPFPAIVGQERLKRALLAVAVNDDIDGLLIKGEKGTAKSTAVRALVDLLPTQRAVSDCPYGCPPSDPPLQCDSCRERSDPPVEERPVPLVTVPLGATRERIVGSLSVTEALDGDATFDPGLLARANRGFLYVDEVNLLDDHLVDVLLDAAASGVNRVERDGMSVSHPADFTLLGTMNPEEGDIRPQLRDRFAIQATVKGSDDIGDRVDIIDTALELGGNTDPNPEEYEQAIADRREAIVAAREDIDSVRIPDQFKETIAEVCTDAGVDGHRGDIAAARTAVAFAALDGRSQVIETDIRDALELALPHRLRSRPFEDGEDLDDVLFEHFDGHEDDEPGKDSDTSQEDDGSGPNGNAEPSNSSEGPSETPGDSDSRGRDEETGQADTDGSQQSPTDRPESPSQRGVGEDDGQADPNVSPPNEGRQAPAEVENHSEPNPNRGDPSEEEGPGSSNSGSTDDSETQEVRPASPAHRPHRLGDAQNPPLQLDESDIDAVDESMGSGRVRTEPSTDAVGPRVRTEPADSTENIDVAASVRNAAKNGQTSISSRDLRQSVNAGAASALVVFAVDASASMRSAMEAAKGTVMELLKEAYQERDEVAFVAFSGEDAEVLLPPTDSVTLAARHLKELPTGDRTPLPAGLDTVRDVIDRAEPSASVAVVVTDGRTNVADGSPTAETRKSSRALGTVADQVLIVDADTESESVGLIEEMVAATDGRAIPLADLSSNSVTAEMHKARE